MNSATTAHGPITIWYSNNAQEIVWGKQVVARWNATHPSEMVWAQEIPSSQSSEEVIGAAITAGSEPCLIYNTSPASVPTFQQQGGRVSLNDFAGGASYIDARTGSLAAQYKSPDGSYDQLPWKSNPVMIFYNKKLFAKAGIGTTAPALGSYTDFLATSAKVVSSGAAKFARSDGHRRPVGHRQLQGQHNYRVVLDNPAVRQSFLNILIFLVINLPLTVGLSLLLANAPNAAIPLRAFFRVSYYVPYVTAIVAVVGVWLFLLNSNGLISNALGPLAPSPSWIAVFVTWKQLGFYILLYLAALQNVPKELAGALLFLFPFYYMIVGSLQRTQNTTLSGAVPHPGSITLHNYSEINAAPSVGRTLVNSGIFTGGVLLGTLIFGVLAGYALAQLRFRGRGALFASMLLLQLIPFQLLIIPLYVLIVRN